MSSDINISRIQIELKKQELDLSHWRYLWVNIKSLDFSPQVVSEVEPEIIKNISNCEQSINQYKSMLRHT